MMVLDRNISWGIAVTRTQNRVHTEGIKEDVDGSKKDRVEMSSQNNDDKEQRRRIQEL